MKSAFIIFVFVSNYLFCCNFCSAPSKAIQEAPTQNEGQTGVVKVLPSQYKSALSDTSDFFSSSENSNTLKSVKKRKRFLNNYQPTFSSDAADTD